jgi:hypothetical protein
VEDHLAGPMATGSHRDRHVRQVDGVEALKQAQRSKNLDRAPTRDHRLLVQLVDP